MKPNFIIIGAAKCATSSLRAVLNTHPDVHLLNGGRESQFFARQELHARGLEWYEALFNGARGESAVGECSNVYTMREVYPGAAERLHAALPHAKLIYMVRDPLPRIESFWVQLRSHGSEIVHYDFNRAVRLNSDRLVDSTNYWGQLSEYRTYFADEQILVLFFEDFTADSTRAARAVCRFLGVAAIGRPPATLVHENPSAGKPAPPKWFSRARASHRFAFAKHVLPLPAREYVRTRWIFKKTDKRPQWDPAAADWVLNKLRDDSLSLLEHCGKRADFWDLRRPSDRN